MTPKPFAATIAFSVATFVSGVGCAQPIVRAGNDAQQRASESEMQIILEALDVEGWNPPFDERLLSIDAYRWSPEEPYELVAFVWFRPVFARGSICIAQEAILNARPSDDGYSWSNEDRYHHWLGQAQTDCAIDSPGDLPQSVITRERIETGAMVQILEAEDTLVYLTLRASDSKNIGDLSGEWRMDEVSSTQVLEEGVGFTYSANFRAPGRSRGPTCTFSFINGIVMVHSVGFWVA